jgi:hypothetical protein
MESFELSFKSQIMLSFFMAFIFITNLNKAEKYCSTQNCYVFIEELTVPAISFYKGINHKNYIEQKKKN